MNTDRTPKVLVTVTKKGKPKVEVLVPVSPEESLKKVAGQGFVQKLKKTRSANKQRRVAEDRKKYRA